MNDDLERQLDEMGPDYRRLVGRMRAAFAAEPRRGVLRRAGWWMAAAALVLTVGLAAVFGRGTTRPAEKVYAVRVTDPHNEYVLATLRNDEAVKELIRTQRADGSWKNAFLTRRNAEALRLCGSPEAHISYKKAKRWLRCAR